MKAAGAAGDATADTGDSVAGASCVAVAVALSGDEVAVEGSVTSEPVPHAVSSAATVRTPGRIKLLFMLFECTEPHLPHGALQ